MSARETLENSPLIPVPISEELPEGRRPDVSEPIVHAYGHCAWWCNVASAFALPNGRSGNTIEEHCGDPFCMGQVGISTEALGVHGYPTYVGVELLHTYMHGVYERGVAHLDRSKIAITLSSGDDHCDEGIVFLDAGNVRSLAATLIQAADYLDSLLPPWTDRR